MATLTALTRVVVDVSRAFARYAEEQGWGRGDYSIYYKINSDWGVVHFTFVSRRIGPSEEDRYYKDVWDYMVRSFEQDPEILRIFDLLVKSKDNVDKGGISRIPGGYELLDEFSVLAPLLDAHER
ncbi:hypothetical protein [Aquisphaera insulae]|uniref:hypothetical protein n=1 Tax=Aquisphaera insulae TaxID=2712864 RepID=UPI0013E9A362|nr:hypothetical protein [Aquisphaera insulae]